MMGRFCESERQEEGEREGRATNRQAAGRQGERGDGEGEGDQEEEADQRRRR